MVAFRSQWLFSWGLAIWTLSKTPMQLDGLSFQSITQDTWALTQIRLFSPLNPVLISPQTLSIENKTKTINFFGMSLHRAVTGKMGINRPTQGFSPLCPQPAAGKRLKATLEKHFVRKHNVLSSVFIFPTLFDILWYSYTGNRRRKNRKHIITYE